jgi:hypothetical protein
MEIKMKKLIIISTVVSTIFLTGCLSDSKHKEVVKGLLSDPDSALFKETKKSSVNKEVLCGEMNAKNKMGGYVGYTRYVVSTIGFTTMSPKDVFVTRFLTERDNASEFASAWRLFCE